MATSIGGPRRHAFTLLQVLVAMGIMTILAGVTLVAVVKAQRAARKTAIAFQLQSLSVGIDAYRADFNGELPPVDLYDGDPAIPDTGAFAICRALFSQANALQNGVSPQVSELYDSKDGPGFRMQAAGKTYGPYLQPDNFRFGYPIDNGGISDMSAPGTVFNAVDHGRLMIADKSGRPILYAPTRLTKPKYSKPNAYYAVQGSDSALKTNPVIFCDIDALLGNPKGAHFNDAFMKAYRSLILQDGETTSVPFVKRVQTILGDSGAGPNANNGRLDADETPLLTRPYLLWSAGVDGIYGPMGGKDFDDVILTD